MKKFSFLPKIGHFSIGHKIGQEHKPMSKFEEYLLLHLGVLLISIGVYFFKFPNNFAIGGVSGISVILNAVIPSLSASTINLIVNFILLIIGFLVFGKEFGLKTAYASMLMSLLIEFFDRFVPLSHPLTGQPLLELIYAVILPGVGAGLLFNIRASSGGTDIIAMITKKYSHLDIGKALFASDILITLMSFIVFNKETALLAILGLMTKSLLVDITIESVNKVKYFEIVTEKPEQILDFIIKKLHRGGTMSKGEGIYMHKEKCVIRVVVSNYEGILLRDYAKTVDPSCFITIFNTSQIIGKGFHFVN